MGKSSLVAKSLLVALAFGALTLLPQDAAADDRKHNFRQGHHQGQVSRFHAPPPKVVHFGQPHKRWQHRPAPRYFAPPGHRAWLHNPARRHVAPPPRGWGYHPWRFKPPRRDVHVWHHHHYRR
jgi:hypothetical protein